jgi:hypothetical protein
MEILNELAKSTSFQIECFGGKLLLECRILSASEVEQIGLGSSLLAQELFINTKDVGLNGIDSIRKKAEEKGYEDLEESEIMRLLDFAKSIKPETMARLSEDQDRVLCKVIKRASQDNGQTWEKLSLCTALEQMDPNNNILWVGIFSSEDRTAIINGAMQGQKEAIKRLEMFQK